MNAKLFFIFSIFFLIMLMACALLAAVRVPVSYPTRVEPREVVPPAFDDRPVVMAPFEMNYFLNEQLI